MHSKYVLAASIICAVLVCTEGHLSNFKRVRQDIENNSDGFIHVFIRVLDYNNSFELHLQKNGDSVFDRKHSVVVGSEEFFDSTDFMYTGTAKGYPNSRVSGTIQNGVFEGSIALNANTKYYIEDGRHFFGHDFCTKDFRFCYIIHGVEHGEAEEKRSKRAADEPGLGMCGWHSPKIRDILMQEISGNAYPIAPVKIPDEVLYRTRRQTSTDNKRICGLQMQADPKLWDLFMKDQKQDERKARAALLAQFGKIIDGVNEIYAASTFASGDGGAGPYTGIQFKILRSVIYTNKTVCTGNANAVLAELCRDNIDSAEFLSINSRMNHDSFCLAYLMTHRQFSEGVQGLAWIGYPKSYAGGVCQRHANVGGKMSSYNTGIVTSNNHGKRSPLNKLTLTFAHEIGHNFGSPHDKEGSCQPGGDSGNYIMYPYVTPGNLPNNKKFSSCSNAKIALNLDAVVNEVNGNKKNCFRSDSTPFCGNGIIETGEQCDCGFEEDCIQAGDKCCMPAGVENECKLVSGATCSPSNGLCCDSSTCRLMTQDLARQTQCRPDTECSAATFCSPLSASCPNASSKADGTLCWEDSRVCMQGECSESLCTLVKDDQGRSYQSCQEDVPEHPSSLEMYCYLACRPPGSSRCINSLSVTEPSVDQPFYNLLENFHHITQRTREHGVQPIPLGAGTPCNNYKGFCDVFHKCRDVNSQGPLASLFSLLTGEKPPETAAEWLVKHWYVVAIVAVIFMLLCLVLTQIFARQCIPSSNPKKHRRRTLKESCQRTCCPCMDNDYNPNSRNSASVAPASAN